MVRLKDRYLLVNIVYTDLPQDQGRSKSSSGSNNDVPDLLIYNQPTTGNIRPQDLLRVIREQIASLFGDCGSGAVNRSLHVKYLSPATSTFILRVSRDHYRLVWAALAFMDRLPTKDGRRCIYRVVRVSGTIRKVEEEAIRRAKLLILAAKDEMAAKKSGSGGSASDALNALFRSGSDSKGSQTPTSLAVSVDDSDQEDASEMEVGDVSDDG